MNKKTLKQIFSNPYVIILLIFLLLSYLAIDWNPLVSGVAIKAVAKNSPAFYAGIQQPGSNAQPRSLELINKIYSPSVGTLNIKDINDLSKVLSLLNESDVVRIYTNRNPVGYLLNLSRWGNGTEKVNLSDLAKKGDNILGLNVENAPNSNLRLGLDLEGGARIIVSPEKNVSSQTLDLIVSNLRERFNVYGLSDVKVRSAKDMSGNSYIIVEMAGASVEQLESLISQQGNFVAKIRNQTVFIGGKKDIAAICNDPTCSFLPSPYPPYNGDCIFQNGQFICGYNFRITISQDAAEKMAQITKNLRVVPGTSHLNETIDFYLDGKKVDSLQIDKGLKGKAVSQPSISGVGKGPNKKDAYMDALANMKKMKTILSTGSLPTKLKVVQVESISPLLGKRFLKNIFILALVAITAVTLVVSLRYHTKETLIPIVITMLSELFILLGFAAFIKWNLDLASIAGIIIAIGSGVDDQVVIVDEIMSKETRSHFINLATRIKNAFFIVFGSYFTTLFAMMPLFWAGVGLLKGFAFTTTVGITIGVFITRPTFARIVEILIKNQKKKEE
ncbi:MAG: hypothetical protein GWP09_01290 [Nitrospiraceae bacterium]|nr:hypothetical protein [Nitrospiraceae bacterium]